MGEICAPITMPVQSEPENEACTRPDSGGKLVFEDMRNIVCWGILVQLLRNKGVLEVGDV